jgi:hypothetical protein
MTDTTTRNPPRNRRVWTVERCNGTAAMAYAYYQGFTDAAALAAPTPSTQED